MKKDRRNGGWVSTLVALVVLIVVGFLCGALAGFLWEEPGLVIAYLSGKTQPVEFSDTAPVAAAPPSYSESAEIAPEGDKPDAPAELLPAPPVPPAVDPPAVEKPSAPPPPAAKPAEKKPLAPAHVAESKLAPEKPAPQKPASEKPTPVKVAAVAPDGGRFSVQVGAFGDSASAEKLVSRLRARGYTAYVKADTEARGKRYRVRVGPVNARARAEELAAKLAKGEKLPTWILDESKG